MSPPSSDPELVDPDLAAALRRQPAPNFHDAFTAQIVARHRARVRERVRERHRTVRVLQLIGAAVIGTAAVVALAVVPPASMISAALDLGQAAARSHIAATLLIGAIALVLTARQAPRVA